MRIMDFGAACAERKRDSAQPQEMAKDVGDQTKKSPERSGSFTERGGSFTTVSGVPVERLYTPEQIKDLDYGEDLGDPGNPPYTRGIYPEMYRSRQWTIRQFSGFGTAADTNERFHYLLKHG